MSMIKPGIPPRLLGDVKNILSNCANFDSPRGLKNYFMDLRISQWHDRLPEADNKAGRIANCCYFLNRVQNSENENGLLLFLKVVHDDLNTDDFCKAQLTKVIEELSDVFNPSSQLTLTNLQPQPDNNQTNEQTASLMEWLKLSGFKRNPFDANCWVAEKDTEVLSLYFKEPKDFLKKFHLTANQAGAKYIFAPYGGGKTALLNYIFEIISKNSEQKNDIMAVKYVIDNTFLTDYHRNKKRFHDSQEKDLVLFTHVQYLSRKLWHDWYPNGKNINNELLSFTVHETLPALQNIINFCVEEFSYDALAVFVDIDIMDASEAKKMCKQYLGPLQALSQQRLFFKIFVPLRLEDAMEIGLRTDRELDDMISLNWGSNDLKELLANRILACHLSKEQPARIEKLLENFTQLFVFEVESTIIDEIVNFALEYGTPRALLMLCYHILSIHGYLLEERNWQINPVPGWLISQETVNKAIDTSRKRLLLI